jgi:hypothetical protein
MQVGGAGFAAAPLVPVQIPLADFTRGPIIESNDREPRLCLYHTVPIDLGDPTNDDTAVNVVNSTVIVLPGPGSQIGANQLSLAIPVTTFATRPLADTGYFGITAYETTYSLRIDAEQVEQILVNIPAGGDRDVTYSLLYVNPLYQPADRPPGLYLYLTPGPTWVNPNDIKWYRQTSITGPLTLPTDNIIARAAIDNNLPLPQAADPLRSTKSKNSCKVVQCKSWQGK